MTRPSRLGRWLRAARAVRGHTQADAAALIGVHPITLGGWEGGDIPALSGLLSIRAYMAGAEGLPAASLDDLAEWARQPADEVTP